MKKTIFLSLLALGFVVTSFAQNSVKKVSKKTTSPVASKQTAVSTGLASDSAVPVQTVSKTTQSTQVKATPLSESAAPYISISPDAAKQTGNSVMPSQTATPAHISVDNGK